MMTRTNKWLASRAQRIAISPPSFNKTRSLIPSQPIKKLFLATGRGPPTSAKPPPEGLGEASMSDPNSPPPQPQPAPLYKQRSWSPDTHRDEAWLRRKSNQGRRNRLSKSVTDEDLADLKACIELGFGFQFDSPDNMDQSRLSNTLPALGLYYAVNKHYYATVSKSSSLPSLSSTASDCDTPSPLGSPHTIFSPGDNPQMVKTRLRQWAQVVACSVRQSSC